MQVLFEDIARFGLEGAGGYSNYSSSSEAFFFVVHPGSWSLEQFLGFSEAQDCIKRGGAILFASGQSQCGRSESSLKLLETERVHVLRPAYDAELLKVQLLRFLNIVDMLKPWQTIPWHEIDPPLYPENVVALSIFIESARSDAPREIVKEAWNEYEARIGSSPDWTAAGLPNVSGAFEPACQVNRTAALNALRSVFPASKTARS